MTAIAATADVPAAMMNAAAHPVPANPAFSSAHSTSIGIGGCPRTCVV
ncbi:hypothetical protein LUW74_12465 [Actinomadura madurae]|nr:hypothetical protein [Actinomadura madurae]URN04062.1 hypothetical protein LUW74_12465 [Actinomadura madurae]